MKLVSQGKKMAVANFLSMALSFAGIIFFSARLGGEQLGTFFLFQAMIGVLSIVGDLGFRGAIEKRLSERDSGGSVISSGLILKSALLILVTILLLFFSSFINGYFRIDMANTLILGLVLHEASLTIMSIIRGEARVGATAGLELLHRSSWVVWGGFLYMLFPTKKSLIYGYMIGCSVALLSGVLISSTALQRPKSETAKNIISFSKYNFIGDSAWQVFNRADILILGIFVSPTAIAAYEVTWRIGNATMLLGSTISKTLFPQVSLWASEGKLNRIQYIIRRSFLPAFILTIPSFFGILLFSEEILGLLFNPSFVVASLAFKILYIQRLFQSIQVVCGRCLLAMDHARSIAIYKVIGVGSNILLNVILISIFGLVGAAIATATSYGLTTALHVFNLNKRIDITVPFRQLIWLIVASIIMSVFLLSIESIVMIDRWYELIGMILIGGAIYSISVLFSSEIRKIFIETVINRGSNESLDNINYDRQN